MNAVWRFSRAFALVLSIVSLTACGQEEKPEEPCTGGRTACGSICVDLDSSDSHCGGCGIACGQYETCFGGKCVLECPGWLEECGGSCVDLDSDPKNCGQCGTVCEGVCQDGECRTECLGDTTDCGGSCVDTSTDTSHCGGCNIACGETEVCEEGACVCPDGTESCDEECVDTQNDASNCGGCGIACGNGQICQEGACVCPEGTELCGDECVDIQSDARHCGGCDQACDVGANVSEVSCVEGGCQIQCAAGFGDCDEDPENGCESELDQPSDCGGCGIVCRDDQVCTEGGCACPEGLEDCDGTCIDTSEDPENCGACGFSCGDRENSEEGSCVEGSCVLTCSEGFGDCDEDTENGCEATIVDNPEHCGACGITCRSDQVCLGDLCACPDEQLECDGLCVDTMSDPNHCGGCNQVCDGACAEGNCCEPGLAACGALCVDLDSDSENCGACGNDCSELPNVSAASCESGACGDIVCLEGYEDCNDDVTDGCEVHLDSDIENCGACGNDACAIGCDGSGACATVVSFSARYDHGCAILSGDGSVKCWGNNRNGQIGNGLSGTGTRSLTPEYVLDPSNPIGRLTGATQVVTGFGHSCVVTTDQTVKCWGQLADPTTGAIYNATEPVDIQDPSDPSGLLSDVVQLASGRNFLCALLSDGSVKCWGAVPDGNALPALQPLPEPVLISTNPDVPLTNAQQVAAGNMHACILHTDSSVSCWGTNGDGQLGKGDTNPSALPVAVGDTTPLNGIAELALSQDHSCARDTDGDVYCWGKNDHYQVGGESPNPTTLPEQVENLSGAVQISAGLFNHTCARLDDGTAKCWGRNTNAKLGNGKSSDEDLAEFVLDDTGTQNLGGIEHIEAGNAHSCALLQTGQIVCWGRNNNGQIGDGSQTDAEVPTPVSW